MTFYIDWFEQDFPRAARLLRIRDETRYVQDQVFDEYFVQIRELSRFERQQMQHAMLKILCAKWCTLFGERIEPVAPEAEGVGWTIRYVHEVEVEGAERPSITGR